MGLLTSTSRTLTPPVMIKVLTSLSDKSLSMVLLELCRLVASISNYGVVEIRLREPLVQPYGSNFLAVLGRASMFWPGL